MSQFRRCPTCLNQVYREARRCTHCGHDLKGPTRLLTRGVWIFVISCVGLFALGDTFYLLHQKRTHSQQVHLDMGAIENVIQRLMKNKLAGIEAQLNVDGLDQGALGCIADALEGHGYKRIRVDDFRDLGSTSHHREYQRSLRRYAFRVTALDRRGRTVTTLFGQACLNGEGRRSRIYCLSLRPSDHDWEASPAACEGHQLFAPQELKFR